MVLRIPFEGFAETAKKYAEGMDAFVAEVPGGTAVTAIHHGNDLIISCVHDEGLAITRTKLEESGLTVREGNWSSDEDKPPIDDLPNLYVAAVSYRSREFQPGLWVDAFPFEPSQSEVLQTMYEEFVLTGEVKAVGFDEFVTLAQVNVLILGPEAIRGYALSKSKESEDSTG